MAVTLTSAVSGRNSSGDLILTNVVVASSDTGIFVLTSAQDSNHANYPVVSMTRDGQSFTKIQHYEPAENVRVEGWYLISPNVNTNDISINVTGAVGEFTACAFIVAGSDTTNQPDTYTGNSGNGTPPNLSLTSTLADELALCVLCSEADITASGQTTQVDYQDQSFENAFYSYETVAAAGSYSSSHTVASGQSYAQMTIIVKAPLIPPTATISWITA